MQKEQTETFLLKDLSKNTATGIEPKLWPKFRKRCIGIILVIIIVAAVVIAYLLGAFNRKNALVPPDPTTPLPPSASQLRRFQRFAVCVDAAPCAEIGKTILDKNGTAVDAAIASLFCNGILTMQSMGLGGGFLMTIYKKDEGKAYTLNARETAPRKAKPELYKDDKMKSQTGPLSIGVPGELAGYWEVHQRFGKLSWGELVQPAIDVCEKGYVMSEHQHMSLGLNPNVEKEPTLKEWFKHENGTWKKPGSVIVPKKMCDTLKIIAEKGASDFYNGTIAKMIVEDVKKIGGLITAEDLQDYRAQWMEPVNVEFDNGDQLYSIQPPGSGVLLAFILNILDGYGFNRSSVDGINKTVLTHHRMVEAFKFAYAKRTELADTNFANITALLKNLTSREYADETRLKINDNRTYPEPKHYGAIYYKKEEHGTAHISVLDANGDAVSVTSSVNIYFGSGHVSPQTGIILNSVMDDFSFPYFANYFGLPGSPNNKLEPGKRPLSSMSPSIIVDKAGDVKMVVGASGGTKITTALSQVVMRSLWLGDNLKEAVDAPRLHHQVFPMHVEYEYGTLKQEVDGLKALGHNMKRFPSSASSVVCALLRVANEIWANADFRKKGDVYGH